MKSNKDKFEIIFVSLLFFIFQTPFAAEANNVFVSDVGNNWLGPVGYDGRPGYELITSNNYQFVAYYDQDGYMTVAKRSLNSESWTSKRLNNQIDWDAHKYVTMDVDNDGNLHISGNMHANPLIYYRTTTPFDVNTLTKIDNMIGTQETQVTYPKFLRGPNNEFLFTYRDGLWGDGVNYFNVYNHANKTWSRYITEPLLTNNPPSGVAVSLNEATDQNSIPITGNWDGIGSDTIGVYNQVTRAVYLKNNNTSGAADMVFGYGPLNNNWLPISGDWNGDGVDTIGLYDPQTQTFYLKNSNTGGVADFFFIFSPASGTNLLPVTGDWNNDGYDTIGLFDPSSRAFWLRNSNNSGAADVTFDFPLVFKAGLLPVAGDWDGDGTDTTGIFDPGTSTFSLLNENGASTTPLDFIFCANACGNRPLAGNWNSGNKSTVGVFASGGNFSLRYRNSGSVSEQMSAYAFGPVKDAEGMFHLVWIWRDNIGADGNHDISYARSRDLIHWETSKGVSLTLPLSINNAEIIDPVPVRGGAINNNNKIGFDDLGRPVISYIKYDAQGNTQVYNARQETNGWKRYQTSNWMDRWDFSGGGTLIFQVIISEIRQEADGGLSQSYQHWTEGSSTWKLDENTFLPIDSYPPPSASGDILIPQSDYQCLEGTSSSGMITNINYEKEKNERNSNYFLRYETLSANRDQPRNCADPLPTLALKLYRIAEYNSPAAPSNLAVQ